ncbi:MAG: GGDEF domain-containing protein [Anaerolineaceae bacterium]|nr:GGDEF domain-containing protein [Anaerolineaceae bacterium]
MKLNLRHWFASPQITADENDQHRVILMNGMINASIFFVVLVFVGNLFDPTTPLRNYLIDILVLAVFLIARVALYRGKILFAGISALTLGFAFTILSTISDGTIRSTAVSLFPLIIIISGFIYKTTGILVSTIASSAAIFILVLTQNAGLMHESTSKVSMLHWFVLTITFIIIGGIVYFSDRITAQAFKNVKEEVHERQRAESELEIANQELQKRMTEVEKLKDELREQALHDSLTGLPNRRHLDEILPHEILRAERNKESLSIIFADVDHFKVINDTYGHPVGDQILVEVAQLLQRELRRSDYIYRYGGDEFVLVLLGSNIESSRKRAEQIREKCAKIVINDEGNHLGVSMSFGIATYPVHGKSLQDIIIKADQALYDAKRLGRNQVRVWESNSEL